MRISAAEVTRLAVDVLHATGVPDAAARLQAETLVEAELRGHASHGLLRLPRLVDRIANGVANPTTRGVHQWVAGAFLEVDGQQGLGPVVALPALDAIIERAERTGIACAAIRASNHLGMLSLYVEKIAAKGLIGIGLTTSEAIVHPWGGRSALIGSNPIAIGVPAHPAPLILDMATSSASMGKVHDYANRELALDPYWAVDADGDPTTDPAAAIKGSLTPFGGPKGYGLAIAFEVLIASLTASATGTDVVGTLDATYQSTKGDVFLALRPPTDNAADTIGAYLDVVRASPRRRPDEPIAVPGDGARQRRRRALDVGIDLPDEVWAALTSYPREVPAGVGPDRRDADRPLSTD